LALGTDGTFPSLFGTFVAWKLRNAQLSSPEPEVSFVLAGFAILANTATSSALM
jgi:hypothetical protein